MSPSQYHCLNPMPISVREEISEAFPLLFWVRALNYFRQAWRGRIKSPESSIHHSIRLTSTRGLWVTVFHNISVFSKFSTLPFHCSQFLRMRPLHCEKSRDCAHALLPRDDA